MLTLLIVDATQIQPYIFGSNRLREQIGASHLVSRATGAWALDALPVPNNVLEADGASPSLDPRAKIEDGAIAAEALYAGGGHLVAIFRDEGGARSFVSGLSRRVLTEAPGVNLAYARRSFDWWGQSLADKMDDLHRDLARVKNRQPPTYPLLGLGVTAACGSTGLPAVGYADSDDDSGAPSPSAALASAETLAKLDARLAAEARVRQVFSLDGKYEFPRRTDQLGRSHGEESHVALVHADGNGMGKRLRKIADAHRAPVLNREYIDGIRAFSLGLNEAAAEAQRDVMRQLIGWVEARCFGPDPPFTLATAADGRPFLPFRPLVFGGDDLTFMSDGRLGLSLAVAYLRAFERRAADLPGGAGPATASAGVAIVKSHFPIARAYQLAESLTKQAKAYRREIHDATGQDQATLDWHFAQGGLAGGLMEIRDREYQTSDGCLILRPVTLEANPGPGSGARSWMVVESAIDAFRDQAWRERHNKVKALRDALRAGPDAVASFLTRFNAGQGLPDVVP
ncbi:MAG: Cas10/Cmr2 second palm domain-containing protein, partial [Chloroflexota bacterium]